MNEKLDQKLVGEFPQLYRDRYKSPKQTLMCFGFSCGDGWYNLIHSLSICIQNVLTTAGYSNGKVCTHNIKYVVASQVKEKFGGLRFYYNVELKDKTADPIVEKLTEEILNQIQGAVSFAEQLSMHICEECGSPGKLRGGGWVRTLCDGHSENRPPLED